MGLAAAGQARLTPVLTPLLELLGGGGADALLAAVELAVAATVEALQQQGVGA